MKAHQKIAPEEDTGQVTARLAAHFVRLQLADIPPRVQRIAGLALLDWYAVTWAGAQTKAARITQAAVTQSCPEGTVVIGGQRRSEMLTSALLNGAAGHMLDYDDVHNAIPGHATAPVAPAILALAEHIGADSAKLLTAFVAGFEMTCRMGLYAAPHLFKRGYQGSSTAGCIGAAVGCAHLLELSAAQTQTAIGIAATQASGLQGTYGSMAKSLNIGKAAQSGLMAALLAQQGLTCPNNLIEAPRGYGDVLVGGGNAAAALGDAPDGWHLYRNLFKLHAACFMNHAPLEALRKLRHDMPFDASDLQELVVRVEGDYHKLVLTAPPVTGHGAHFNLKFCLALALAGYDTGLPDTFCDALAGCTDLHNLATQCRIEIDPDVHFEAAHVSIRLNDGRTATRFEDAGASETDLDKLTAQIVAKAHKLLPRDVAQHISQAFLNVAQLPSAADVHPLKGP